MSKARVIVLAVVHQGLTKAEAARRYGVSWQWVHTLVTRYHTGGLDALEPRSRRPASSPKATPAAVADRIVELRKQLDADGLDAGPVTIAHYLALEGIQVPSTATIRRITPPVWWSWTRRNGPAARCTDSPPTSPMAAGSPTSPTGRWQTAPTPRS